MNKQQHNKMYGWKAVRNVLSANRATWEGLPAFRRSVDELNSCWDEVSRNSEVQALGVAWATDHKNGLRARAIQLALRAAGNLKSWAEDHDEGKVKAVMGFTKSSLNKTPEPELGRVLDRIITCSEAHLEELAGYGTDTEFLDAFKEVSAGFMEGVASPKSVRSGRKTATGNIAAAIRSGDKALERLDSLVLNFTDSDPDFVRTYQAARSAVHHGVRHIGPADPGKAAA